MVADDHTEFIVRNESSTAKYEIILIEPKHTNKNTDKVPADVGCFEQVVDEEIVY